MELFRTYTSNLAAGVSGSTVAPKSATDGRPVELATPAAIASEFHFRVVFSLSMLFLPLLAAPFGIMAHRSSKSFGLVAGLLSLVSYHKVLEFAEAYAQNTGAPAGLLLWSIFGLFAFATTYLFLRTGMKSGSPPVQQLEAAWSAMIDRIVSLFHFRRSSAQAPSA